MGYKCQAEKLLYFSFLATAIPPHPTSRGHNSSSGDNYSPSGPCTGGCVACMHSVVASLILTQQARPGHARHGCLKW